MRIQNSFAAAVAAAVAAVVFSAAFQPAEAGHVSINDFSSPDGTQTFTNTTINSNSLVQDPTTGAFTNSSYTSAAGQLGGTGRTNANFTQTVSIGSGLGTFATTKAAITPPALGRNSISMSQEIGFVNPGNTPVSFLGNGSPVNNDTLQIKVAALNVSLPFVAGGSLNPDFPSGLTVFDSAGRVFNYVTGTGGLAIGDNNIPFSSFVYGSGPTGDFDWGNVTYLGYANGMSLVDSTGVATRQALSNSITFDKIQAVPEPTQLVSVAAVGAMYGAWRLWKHRRSRTAAGDATAG